MINADRLEERGVHPDIREADRAADEAAPGGHVGAVVAGEHEEGAEEAHPRGHQDPRPIHLLLPGLARRNVHDAPRHHLFRQRREVPPLHLLAQRPQDRPGLPSHGLHQLLRKHVPNLINQNAGHLHSKGL